MADRYMWQRIVGYVLLGLAINQFIVFTGNRSLRAAEAAGEVADARWEMAEPLGAAVRASAERTMAASDSLQVAADSLASLGDLAALRASEAVERADSITVVIGETTTEFWLSLSAAQVPSFEALVGRFEQRHEQMDIALSEKGAEVVSLEQAIRTINRDRDGLRAQIGRDALAIDAFEEAALASRSEADRWETAANPGFVLGLWKDLPKLAAVAGAAYLYGRSGN